MFLIPFWVIFLLPFGSFLVDSGIILEPFGSLFGDFLEVDGIHGN
jgi:hypothetical protein